MIVEIVTDPDGVRRWLKGLAEALHRGPEDAVFLTVREGAAGLPSAVGALLGFERLVYRRHRPCGADRAANRAAIGLGRAAPGPAALIVNLSAEPIAAISGRVLQVRYDGSLGEAALAGCLLEGRSPEIAIEDVGAGRIVASGVASLEAADGLGGGMEAVFSRVGTLLKKALAATDHAAAPSATMPPAVIASRSAVRVGTVALKGLASRAARSAYRLATWAPHWRVGYRFTDAGIFERRDLAGEGWQVLGDPGTHFYADPFAIVRGGRHYLFFEDLDHRVGKGIISVTEIGADGGAGPVVPVLEEPWHLSYPFLIEHEGELFMIPESSTAGDIALYRAVEFPHRWERHATLLTGIEAADATIIRHDGRFYLFAVTRSGIGGYSDTLEIFHADDLLGPWRPHAGNPLMVDPAAARPAGGFIRREGMLYRPVQDCRDGYGAALGIARIDRLDAETFGQTVETVLRPDRHWPGRKLHTLNRAGRLETIDGCVIRPKSDRLTAIAERHYAPDGAGPV